MGLDERAARGAHNLVENHLRVQEGEHVVVLHHGAGAVVAGLMAVLRELGAEARALDLDAPELSGSDVTFAARLRLEVRSADAALFVSDDESSSGRGPLLVSTMETTGVRYLHAVGLTPKILASSLRAHPQQLAETNERLAEQLEAGGELTLSSPAGTKLSLTLESRYPLVRYDGVPAPGRWESVPSGAVSVHPVGAEGTYVVDRLLRGGELTRWGRELQRTPVTLRIAGGRVDAVECSDGELQRAIEERIGTDRNAAAIGFVSIATNPLCLNELRTFANDALLPGLRLMLGYSDPKKTKAPRSSNHWTTVLGRRHELAHQGVPIVTAGRLAPRWVG